MRTNQGILVLIKKCTKYPGNRWDIERRPCGINYGSTVDDVRLEVRHNGHFLQNCRRRESARRLLDYRGRAITLRVTACQWKRDRKRLSSDMFRVTFVETFLRWHLNLEGESHFKADEVKTWSISAQNYDNYANSRLTWWRIGEQQTLNKWVSLLSPLS